MEYFIIVALVILVIFAVTDLTVGVANDAVNFLNSAWGSKAGSVRLLMILVSLGVLVGVLFSGGMMEVARKGIFNPHAFYLNEIIILFVAVMMTDVILLDFFNTMGLPTSTTVSLVFALLGSSFALAVIKIVQAGETMAYMNEYLNSGKALAIISGIFMSVVIAFIVGMIVQYITRLLFSFSYKRYRLIGGSIFGGISIASISYFIFYKGMKSVSFITPETIEWSTRNIVEIISITTLVLAVLFLIFQLLFKFNVFRFIVLYGTFALAMSFAGNDLVNFIGVPLAGISSFELYQASGAVDPSTFSMEGLASKAHIQTVYLLVAGLIMIVTIWFNKKLRSVLNTSINLSRQSEGKERFHSSSISRGILHFSKKMGQILSIFRINKVHQWVSSRFEDPEKNNTKKDAPAFDMIRASVNLSVASSLIAFATSLKLPLSTTYVTFMVAMGTSLSDKAWGRESAVYRITGVLTVVGGWFLTALIAFLFAAAVAVLIYYTEWIGLLLSFALAVFLFLRSHFMHRKKYKASEEEKEELIETESQNKDLIKVSRKNVNKIISNIPELFSLLLKGINSEELKKIRLARKAVKNLEKKTISIKENITNAIEHIDNEYENITDYYIENIELLREIAVSFSFIVNPIYEHMNNHHKNLNKKQISDIKITFSYCSEFVEIAKKCMYESKEKTDICAKKKTEINKAIRKLKVGQIKDLKEKKITGKSNLLFMNILGEVAHIINHVNSLVENETDIKKQYPDF